MKDTLIEDGFFLLKLLDFFGRTKALDARKEAQMNKSVVVIGADVGKLLGGNLTMRLEFDERRKECQHRPYVIEIFADLSRSPITCQYCNKELEVSWRLKT